MAAGLASIGGMLAFVVLAEGGMALWDYLEGDPEADVATALARIQAENQIAARERIAGRQRGEEAVEEKFARFMPIGREALTTAAQLRRPETVASLRGGQEVQGLTGERGGELLDLVATRLGISPEELVQRTAPSRMGDYTRTVRQVGGSIPTP